MCLQKGVTVSNERVQEGEEIAPLSIFREWDEGDSDEYVPRRALARGWLRALRECRDAQLALSIDSLHTRTCRLFSRSVFLPFFLPNVNRVPNSMKVLLRRPRTTQSTGALGVSGGEEEEGGAREQDDAEEGSEFVEKGVWDEPIVKRWEDVKVKIAWMSGRRLVVHRFNVSSSHCWDGHRRLSRARRSVPNPESAGFGYLECSACLLYTLFSVIWLLPLH